MRFFFHLIDWRQNLAFLLSLESNMRPQEHQGPWFCFQTGLHGENIRAGRWLHLYLPCKQGDLRLDPQHPHKSQLQCTLESLALDKQTKEPWDALARQHSWISELQLQWRPCQKTRQSATGRSWGRSLAATRLCAHARTLSLPPHRRHLSDCAKKSSSQQFTKLFSHYNNVNKKVKKTHLAGTLASCRVVCSRQSSQLPFANPDKHLLLCPTCWWPG